MTLVGSTALDAAILDVTKTAEAGAPIRYPAAVETEFAGNTMCSLRGIEGQTKDRETTIMDLLYLGPDILKVTSNAASTVTDDCGNAASPLAAILARAHDQSLALVISARMPGEDSVPSPRRCLRER